MKQRAIAVAVIGLVLQPVSPFARLPAQLSVHIGAGARYGTALIRDSIVVPIELRPAIAPTLHLAVRDELRGPWTADATLDITPTPLRRHESGASFDAGSVTAIALTVGLRRALANGVRVRLGIGGVIYQGSAEGPFRDGGGGIMPAGSLTGSYPVRGFAIEARYDVHRFITPALRAMRFNNPRPVHRISLTVSRRVFGKESGR